MKMRFILIIIAVFILTACEKDGKLQLHMVELGNPEIISFEPQSGKPGTVVHISGNNFSDQPANIAVAIGDWHAIVNTHAMHDLYIVVPDPSITSIGNISVEVNGKSTVSATGFTILTPWSHRARFPGSTNFINQTFVLNGRGYLIEPYTSQGGIVINALWEYDPDQDVWSRKADMPGGARYSHTDFTLGNKAYVGLGYGENANPGGYFNDFWVYAPDSDSWTRVADYPGERKSNALSFPVDGKGYVTGGNTDSYIYSMELWEYDPVPDSWLRKNDLPFPLSNDIELANTTYLSDYEGNIYNFNPDQESFIKITSNASLVSFNWLAVDGSIYFFEELPVKGSWIYDCLSTAWSVQAGPFPFTNYQGTLNFSGDTVGFCIDLQANGDMYGFTPGNFK
jgi:hypothetical protein